MLELLLLLTLLLRLLATGGNLKVFELDGAKSLFDMEMDLFNLLFDAE